MKLTTVLVLAMSLTSTLCWWQVGHMSVAQIAQNYLQVTGKTEVYNKFFALIQGLNPFTDGRSNTFPQAAVWADDLKQYNATYFNEYHFTNIVYDPNFLFKGMTDFQRDVNAINVIGHCMSVLKANKDSVSFERAFMARFLLHLVGDIHQPLHGTNMFNETYKNGDLGGNLIHVLLLDGKDINLHAYFDSIAVLQSTTERLERPLNDAGKAYISDIVNSITKDYPPEYFGDASIKLANPHTWGVDSYNLAVDKIYSFVKTNKQITQEYQNKMRELCRAQVALAGYRLANMISLVYA